MYTLRKIQDNVQSNTSLGESYNLVERDSNYDEFQKAYKAFFDKDHVADLDTESCKYSKDTYAFVIFKGGSEIIPLYKNQSNYIMTESGATFANITYK